MMRKFYVAFAGIALVTLFSCAGKDSNDYVDKSLITPEAEKKATEQAATNAETNVNNTVPNTPVIPGINNNVDPGLQTTPVNLIPQNNTAQTSTTPVSGNLNPAHGQPGHRCDISVGAPLDSKPVPGNAEPVTVNSQPAVNAQPAVTMKEVPNQQKTAPGMNPPHGEPGHRCDISVGAPLDSKPAPAATANNDAKPANATTISTVPAPAQKTAPGMNPPHGEAGHRCDIGVGEPLNSKPATAAPSNTPPPLLTPVKKDNR
jgi:hypothetical protein